MRGNVHASVISLAHAVLANPEPRPRARAPHAIPGIGKLALLQRQASAADALRETGFQALQLGDAIVDAPRPAGGQFPPVRSFRHAVAGQLRELNADFLERQTDLLRKDNEGDAAEDGARVAAVAGPGPLRRDQSAAFIK